jgi:hypothetical protein
MAKIYRKKKTIGLSIAIVRARLWKCNAEGAGSGGGGGSFMRHDAPLF